MTLDAVLPARPRRVLITWGTQRGGTAEIAKIAGEVLQREGVETELAPAAQVRDLSRFDAVIIGGALYANRWHRDARRFVARHIAALRRVPVWLFSSGPLDASAEQREIPPVRQVSTLMERIGARGHVTFGGRLRPDARGFPAAAMARKMSGDWRNPERIRAWASGVARALPEARPGIAVEPPARSVGRLLVHGGLGWALCAAVMAGLLSMSLSASATIAMGAVATLVIFAFFAAHYFRPAGAREPGVVALVWTVLGAVVVAAGVAWLLLPGPELGLFARVAFWLPLLLGFGVTWLIGLVMSITPGPRPAAAAGGPAPPGALRG